MVDEQDPAKRVVKRVVKKTVVRPATQTPAPPTVRYGRPVATAARPQAKTAQRPDARTPASSPAPKGPRQKIARQRPAMNLGAKAAGARDVAGRAWWAAADTTTDAAKVTAGFVAARSRAVAAWRLPHLPAYLASVITGVVVALVAVALGAVSLAVFESVRGVASGGGQWGGVTFVVIAAVAVLLGESLLRGFGTRSARATSFVAVVLAIIAMLGLFLDLADSAAAIVVLPLLGSAAYAVAHWLVDLAENAPSVVE